MSSSRSRGTGSKILKIAITGGPCSGKSTALSWINDEFTKRGWAVYLVAESATEAAAGNASPHDFVDKVRGQAALYHKHMADEQFYEKIAEMQPGVNGRAMIVCDRGAVDMFAFMDEKQGRDFADMIGTTRRKMMQEYDAVFHLVSAAIGAEEFYTTDNNFARREGMTEAALTDKRIMAAWAGHPHLRIIDNSTDFHTKMLRLIREIATLTGESQPHESFRKFLIEKPSEDEFHSIAATERSDILQTYLSSEPGKERRVRQRGVDGIWVYTMTTKTEGKGSVSRIETEHRLTEREYVNLLMEADTSIRQIRKTRWCVPYESTYCEIDVFPFSDEYAILEVELITREDDFELPPFIKIVREVTDDAAYRNRTLADSQKL